MRSGRRNCPISSGRSSKIKAGRYRMRWLDDQGVQHEGKLPELMWRAGRIDTLFGLLTFKDRAFQRIQILAEDVECEPELIEAAIAWDDPPDVVMAFGHVPISRRETKPSNAEVAAFLHELEAKYAPGPYPTRKEILEMVREPYPAAARDQVRALLKDLPLKGERGVRSNREIAGF